MEQYSNRKKYPHFNKEKDNQVDSDKSVNGEDFYKNFTYSELGSILRHKIIDGEQLAQKMIPFVTEFNPKEYYSLTINFIRQGFDKIDFDKLENDIVDIKSKNVKKLYEDLQKEEQRFKEDHKKKLEKLKKLGLIGNGD